ncbi:MAG: HlyD family efflux transporter periplasmic adaptor subunit, partial [Bacteroidota bacterium]
YKSAQSSLVSLQENYTETQNALNLNVERSQVQLNSQQSMLNDYVLKPEASGQVIQVFKKQGELVRRGEAIARIGSGDYVIKLFIAEEDITKVDLNQSVAVNINTYPDHTFPANITKIYPAFDEAEQSYIVEAQFEELPEKMFSGTQLQANIQTGTRKNVMVIPTAYVAKGSFVMLESGEERQIKMGSQNGEWTEVISGISAQDIITKPMN